ncbi:MAG: hypothetical protein ABSD85_15680 [Acidimicrobiales bacterium]
MCRAVSCRKCGRPTWRGCGAHVEQVLGHVPSAERCQCGQNPSPTTRPTAWGHLFGRRNAPARN